MAAKKPGAWGTFTVPSASLTVPSASWRWWSSQQSQELAASVTVSCRRSGIEAQKGCRTGPESHRQRASGRLLAEQCFSPGHFAPQELKDVVGESGPAEVAGEVIPIPFAFLLF